MNPRPIRLGETVLCPACGSSAMTRLEDKSGVFYVCSTCSYGREKLARKRTRNNSRKRYNK